MNSSDYFKQAQEYYKTADDLLKPINKYKKELKGSGVNREHINSIIFQYEMLRAEALGMAHSREAKAKQVERKEVEKARIKSETAKFLIKSQKA